MDKSFLVLFLKKELLSFLYQLLFQLTHVTLAKTSAPGTKAWILRSAQDDGGGGRLLGRVGHSKGWYTINPWNSHTNPWNSQPMKADKARALPSRREVAPRGTRKGPVAL